MEDGNTVTKGTQYSDRSFRFRDESTTTGIMLLTLLTSFCGRHDVK